MTRLDETEQLQPDERRQHDRSRLIVDVFFDGADATGVASTKDISLGGLYMNTQTVLPEGALLTLRIPLSDEQQVVVNAEVIYSNPGRGVGVRFHGLTEKDRALMERDLPQAMMQRCVHRSTQALRWQELPEAYARRLRASSKACTAERDENGLRCAGRR